MTTDQRPLTHEDYADAAESAQRGNAWAQAAVLWQRAADHATEDEDRDHYLDRARQCEIEAAIGDRLEEIAKRELRIPTLTERRSDSLDFHELNVWRIKQALKAAYQAGLNDAK